jgi:hypothetical protein
MPYTKALLDAIPRVERPPHTPLPVVAGPAARPGRAARRLPVRAALPKAQDTVPRERAAAGRGLARPPLGVLVPVRGRRMTRQRRRAAALGAQRRAGVRGARRTAA